MAICFWSIMSKANNFQKIRQLTFVQQGALALTVLERMAPNYELFSESLSFGDWTELRNVLNSSWEKLAIPKAKISIERLVEKVEDNTPDLAEFDVFGVYPAIDFCTALITFFSGVQDKEAANFLDVCKISQASVAKFIEYSLTASGELADNEAVRNHPLMQYEMEVLGEFIDSIAAISRFEMSDVKKLKALALEDGQSNLGIEV